VIPVKKISIPDNLTTLAYKTIKEYIWQGRLDEGERLTEEYLANLLGISKSPIREALNRLETEGLIRIEPRRGAYLKTFTVKDLKELYDIRGALEGHVIRTVHITPELMATMRQSVERLKKYREKNDKFRFLEEAVSFHGLLAQSTGNERLAKTIFDLNSEVWIFRRRTYSIPESTGVEYHAAILRALENGDRQEAQRFMQEHLSVVRDRLIAHLESEGAKRALAQRQPARSNHSDPVRKR
jgi:DNA-binding GntR family transcriptional regulator